MSASGRQLPTTIIQKLKAMWKCVILKPTQKNVIYSFAFNLYRHRVFLMNAGYQDETCHLCKKQSQTFKYLLLECEENADLADLMGLFTTRDLFATRFTDQWASILYVATFINNSLKEDAKAVQDIETRLIRTMIERNSGMFSRRSRGDQMREIDPPDKCFTYIE